MMRKGIIGCLVVTALCGIVCGCGKELTEYEKACEHLPILTNEEQAFLEKSWYGNDWKYYDDWTGEVNDKNYVIDEKMYGNNPYVIRECDLEYQSIDYELFDLDTGSSHGLWRDDIETDDGIERIYTKSLSVEGFEQPGILFRQVR